MLKGNSNLLSSKLLERSVIHHKVGQRHFLYSSIILDSLSFHFLNLPGSNGFIITLDSPLIIFSFLYLSCGESLERGCINNSIFFYFWFIICYRTSFNIKKQERIHERYISSWNRVTPYKKTAPWNRELMSDAVFQVFTSSYLSSGIYFLLFWISNLFHIKLRSDGP